MRRAIIDFRTDQGRRFFERPVRTLTAHTLDEIAGLLDAVAAARRDNLYAVGYLAYESAAAFDPAFETRAPANLPLACFGLFAGFEEQPATDTAVPALAKEWRLNISRPEFEACVHDIRETIAAGGVYQVNFTARQRGEVRGSSEAWYDGLRRAQGPGFHALLEFDDFTIVSISPELFVQRRGSVLTTRPMKGTRARGRWHEEDQLLRSMLVASEKDQAELLMIVDLMRNDLGRVADPGGVRVVTPNQVEQYRTVWQLTATIEAQVDAAVGLREVLGALFPCGSVTGAPKIAAMRKIAQLETTPRGVYCGAIGVVEPGGSFSFNVPIRTCVVRRDGSAEYGVGSGIVWDSEAELEFEELRAKSAVLVEQWPQHFELIETMLLRDHAVPRLSMHLDRLERSALYFGWPFERAQVSAAIGDAAAQAAAGDWRLRLLYNELGTASSMLTPVETVPQPIVRLARRPICSTNRFLYHKTTHRTFYDDLLDPDAFDTLLYNERGELTEFTRGNLVIELEGRRLTPAIRCGLLPGVFRQTLLDGREIEEAVIVRDALVRCTRIWLINAVRGWVEVDLIDS